jgi:phosphatidylglycerophosphate synthase
MSFLQRIFSEQYVNRGAIGSNMLLYAMYRFAYPFAFVFNRLGVTPDAITTLSILTAILAFASLVLNAPYPWFVLLWALTILLDFCDGTVARMSGRIATRMFRFDHMSDMAKIGLVVLGTALRSSQSAVWVLSFVFVFLYLYSEILHHDLKHVSVRASVAPAASATLQAEKDAQSHGLRQCVSAVRVFAERLPCAYALVHGFYIAVTTFNGHTLLVFLLLPFGGAVTCAVLSYLILLSLQDSFVGIRRLWRMQR